MKLSALPPIKQLCQTLWPFLPLTLLVGYLASYALWTDSTGNIVTALPTGWGDMIVHIRAAIFYAEQGGFPHQSFLLSNQPIGYAWPADYLSSLLLNVNTPLTLAFALPTIFLSGLFAFLLQYVAWRLTNSRSTAILAAVLFIGFSGLSGFYTLPELKGNSPSDFMKSLRTLTHHVTAWHDANLVILNPFVMMLHQRGYLLGFPLLTLAIFYTWQWVQTQRPTALITQTSLTLLLALTHPFTWAAWLLIFPTWLLLLPLLKIKKYTRQQWLHIGLSALLSASLGYAIIHSLQPTAASSLMFAPGWLANSPQHSENWVRFWMKNIGLFILLLPFAVHHLWQTNRPLAAGLLASLTPFAAANLFQFAPWDWDNTKLFAPTWLFFALGSATFLRYWWQQRDIPARKTAITILVGTLIFSGTLEILRVVSHRHHPLPLSTPADQATGEDIRAHTNPTDVILTAPNPPNHPVFLHGGRPSLIAYEGWLWSQGWAGIYEPRLSAAQTILRGGPQAPQLLQQYGIDIVAIGPPEASAGVNHAWFDQNFPILLKTDTYTLYDRRQENTQ